MDDKSFRRVIFWAAIANILAFIVPIIIFVYQIKKDIKEVQKGIERIEDLTVMNQFLITNPKNGADVELTDIIQGRTPYLNKNHYIVVTPIKTGDDFVQDGPVKV